MSRLIALVMSLSFLFIFGCSVFHSRTFQPDRWDDSEAYIKAFMGAAIKYKVDPDAMLIMSNLERLQRYVHYHDVNVKAETDEHLLALYRDADRRRPDHYITASEARKFYQEYVRAVENNLPGSIERLYDLESSPSAPTSGRFVDGVIVEAP